MQATPASAYLTSGVAALAIIASVISTRLTLQHQRLLAEDERLWTHRADTYVLLLQHQRDDPTYSRLLPAEVASQLIAYGSEEVQQGLAAVRATSGHDPEAFGAALDALVAQIRLELQRKPDKGRLFVASRWQQRG